MVSILEDSIEFDVVYPTNNLGLIDHRDYPVDTDSRFQYAFVGDSFTYGMGADPWVPNLRDRLHARGSDIEIYNLGVNGASIRHFRTLLSSVAAELPITHIVVIAISNDFYRRWWVPIVTADGTSMCWDPPDCGKTRLLSPIIDFGAAPAALVTWYRDVRAALLRQQAADPVWKRALWRSQLYLLLRRGVRQIYGRFVPIAPEQDPNDLEDPARLGPNLEALAGIRTDFPKLPITLAHFPQVDEVRNGRYELDLAQEASDLAIDYFPALMRCSWSADMYHAANLHPNAVGYRNFADCLWLHLSSSQ
jgi:lysophospholipase L1-like esterase